MTKASDLGMDLSGYGQADVNPNSGYVYLWLEDYPFTLYIDLGSDTVYASWSNYYNGEEDQTSTEGETLESLIQWCEDLEKEIEVD